jgi:predicted cation transporter
MKVLTDGLLSRFYLLLLLAALLQPCPLSIWTVYYITVWCLQVIELLGKENIKLNTAQMSEIMSVLRKEEVIVQAEKQQKIERKLQQQQQTAAATNEATAAEKKVGQS